MSNSSKGKREIWELMFFFTKRQLSDHFCQCLFLTYIQWSGAEYVDALLMTVSGGVSSTAAMGKGVTENQFKLINEKAKAKM